MPLDPAVRALVARLPAVDWGPGLDPRALRERRRGMRRPASGPDVHDTEDRDVPGADGAPDVRVRCYRPAPEPGLPLVIFFHGGGFVLGDLDTQDALARRIALDSRAVVVSVDYRLAPEHPFPAAPADAMTVYRWALRYAGDLGADPARIAVCGESSGGNLAAVVCQSARDEGLPLPVFQLLWYPSTDFCETPSRRENADAPLLTLAALRWLDGHYLPPELRDQPPPTAAPLRAPSLAGLPPAHVVVAQYDPLRDEGVAYARRLAADGVPTRLEVCTTMPHGFLSLIEDVPSCRTAADPSFGALRRALHPDPARSAS
ncbi:alpha/beta hydrolase [Streptomyces sp. CSDS2]|uniref:alpha/beta hydrolase n=1 Tax=Streptomyces sp. CSDS2 TaxID=3055051 RepID=UPI0025B128E6|nr:alpha/beta hydrolase [Streptomyces sp. CSDS2]MDN3263508.1 alpha/beta hydrolase [Streptomyces sp. CSDS2]